MLSFRKKELSWEQFNSSPARKPFWCSLTVYYKKNVTFYPGFMECLIQKHFSMFKSFLPVLLAFCPVSIKTTFLFSSGFSLPLWCSFRLWNARSVHSFPSNFLSSWFLRADGLTAPTLPRPLSIPRLQADIRVVIRKKKREASVDHNPTHRCWNLTSVSH